jgi:transposase-like protein
MYMTHRDNFPNTLVDAILYFSDENTCREFLADLRWPNGVRCLQCGSDRLGKISTRHLWRCKDCKYEFSVRKGTIFEDSAIPLSKWMAAMWIYSASKKGRSSHQLAKDLGVTQKTAWHMSHRIRLAMETESFENPLSGEVEADETYVGGQAKYQHESKRKHIGTGGAGKAVVMGLLERHGEVRARTIPNVRMSTIDPIVRANVEPGSSVYTDALRSYTSLDDAYAHEVIDHAESYVRGHVHTNGLENFWSIFKRTVYGTHHCIDPVHLDRYLGETAYRFNTRDEKDGQRFTDVVSRVAGKRLTWKELTA